MQVLTMVAQSGGGEAGSLFILPLALHGGGDVRRCAPPSSAFNSTILGLLTTSCHLINTIIMNALVAKLQPQSFRREEEEEDFAGYGNLDKRGFVTGMALPRVADVSVHLWPWARLYPFFHLPSR